MKWFKHFSSMRLDTKIKRLINKFGIEGYGLYNYILECIAFNLEANKPVPEIEETAQDLAIELRMDTLKVEEIIRYCFELNLFELNKKNNRIMCLKLLNHLDNTLSSNPEIRKILNNFNKLQETSSDNEETLSSNEETLTDFKPLEADKIRLDEIRLDKKQQHKDDRNIMMDEEDKVEEDAVVDFSNNYDNQENYKKLIKYRIDEKTALNLIKNYAPSYIQEKIKQYEYIVSHSRDKPKNPTGFLYKSIIDNYCDEGYVRWLSNKNASEIKTVDFDCEIDKFIVDYESLTKSEFDDSEEVRRDMKTAMLETSTFGYLEFLIIAFRDYGRNAQFWEYIGIKSKEFDIYELFKNVAAIKLIISYVKRRSTDWIGKFQERIRDPVAKEAAV